MTARRARGDGGLHWDAARQRWIVTVTLGYNTRGKRVTRKASGRTKSEAKKKLTEIQACSPRPSTATRAAGDRQLPAGRGELEQRHLKAGLWWRG